jgi:drug/metabolite transporter (DMT)-like permease
MSGTPEEEALAARRFMLLGLVRLGAIVTLIFGLAIVREVIAVNHWLGIVIAVAGMLAFFFAPPLLAKRWKASDRGD